MACVSVGWQHHFTGHVDAHFCCKARWPEHGLTDDNIIALRDILPFGLVPSDWYVHIHDSSVVTVD